MKVVIEFMALNPDDKSTMLPAVITEINLDDSITPLSLEWFGIEGGLIELDDKPCFVRGTKKSYNTKTGQVDKYLQIQELSGNDIKRISIERQSQMERMARQQAAQRAGIELVDQHGAAQRGLSLPGNSLIG